MADGFERQAIGVFELDSYLSCFVALDARAAMEAALETAKEMDSEIYSHTIIASPSEDSELAIRMTINK